MRGLHPPGHLPLNAAGVRVTPPGPKAFFSPLCLECSPLTLVRFSRAMDFALQSRMDAQRFDNSEFGGLIIVDP